MPTDETKDFPSPYADAASLELEEMLYARHAETESLNDLTKARGTAIPALFSQFYKFIQNPSSVSVETFKRMVDTDDTVGSGVDFLTTCLAARLGRYTHKSEEITKWVNERLDEIDGGFVNVLKEILSASWAGYYVGEKDWANTEKGFVIKRVIPMPPSTVLFETDRTGVITEDGILQYQRNFTPSFLAQGVGMFGGVIGIGSGFNQQAYRPDMFAKFGDLPFPLRTANTFNYMSIRIPRQKCIHYAFDAQGKFGNPYGRSLLRRAYKYYVMKDAFLQMMSVALDRKGTPLTIVYADHNTTLMDASKIQQGVNLKGQKVGMRADVAAKEAFKNIHNDSFIVLPGKKGQIFDTDFVPQDANTEAFVEALNFCNKSIMRALLVPSLIFGNGDGAGSFALGQEHARTFDKILDGMLAGVQHVLIQQMVKEMIAYNFPASAWQKDGLGSFSKREFSQDERQKEAEMFEKGVNIGIIDSDDLNDLNQMRDTLGFEPRTEPIQKPLMGGMFGEEEPELDENGMPIPVPPGKDEPQASKRSSGGGGGRRKPGKEEDGNFNPADNLR